MAFRFTSHSLFYQYMLLLIFTGLLGLQFLFTLFHDYSSNLFCQFIYSKTNIIQLINLTSSKNKTVIVSPPVNVKHLYKSKNFTALKNVMIKPIKQDLSECPLIPNNLIGLIKLKFQTLSIDELEKLHSELEIGGIYKPPDCKSRHKVAIIIPYRDRYSFLKVFLLNIHPFLQRQQLEYAIYIIEQAGNKEFNRAKLFNVGFKEALRLKNDWHCFIFHDVDLLPENDYNFYICSKQPRHMSDFRLPYLDLFGGVCALTKEQFEKVNGFSNEFWGWGGEDDDMSRRLQAKKYHIARYPTNIARYYMLEHKKSSPNPKRFNLLKNTGKRFKNDGLNTLTYRVKNIMLGRLYTWICVEL